MTEELNAYTYSSLASSDRHWTVVAEYERQEGGLREAAYQSEAELEKAFIRQLVKQGYEYLSITSEAALIAHLRSELELLNDYRFTDGEWDHFFRESIAGANEGILEKTERIQRNEVQAFRREDGTVKNIKLIDKEDIHRNRLQVINQYEAEGARATRYDVTILVNGLPLVHVELKRRGVDLREAFNQIKRYSRDSFWAGSGLFDYVQLFVISNGTRTKYYSNTVRQGHVDEQRGGSRKNKETKSFSFTSWWADAQNKVISDLPDFTRFFFARHTLLNLLTRYCVFDTEQRLLVMRPYQIAATERILERIQVAANHKLTGRTEGGGFIWHTTGSGKTLTSFKTAQLATKLPFVDKVLFVVDRKDLDHQTMQEYDRFEKGAANGNTSTRILQEQLEDRNKRIIITTIQKLSRFVAGNRSHGVYGAHVVIIFDECHRSQFGQMHLDITKAFKKYHLFGFTGTPIFDTNARALNQARFRTTEQIFGEQLHSYTIVDAISDKNVLPFRIDYIRTIRTEGEIEDKKVPAIDTERALLAPERIAMVVDYIFSHFEQKTRRTQNYRHEGKTLRGFNSLFACDSIDAAKQYYQAIQQRNAALPSDRQLKVGLIYSWAPNEEEPAGLMADESLDTEGLDAGSRDFLDRALEDYNGHFGTSFDTSSTGFANYYIDLSARLKKREVDMAIVVNMFLTGFDAQTLNTLWVDKNLRFHGLIQAYSRTNRILNSVKTYGNIVSFRNLEKATDDALALFGNKEARGIAVLKPFQEWMNEYAGLVTELQDNFAPDEHIVSEARQKEFIRIFGALLRIRNVLVSYDEFKEQDPLTDRDFQDYQSIYLELHNHYRNLAEQDREEINDDLVFEIELIKQVEITVDYILLLVEQYLKKKGTKEGDAIRQDISRQVNASPTLRSKKDLIESFVDSVSVSDKVDQAWVTFIRTKQKEELETLIAEERLKPEETARFIRRAFQEGTLTTTGTEIVSIMPPTRKFGGGNKYGEMKARIIEKLQRFFERFFGLMRMGDD